MKINQRYDNMEREGREKTMKSKVYENYRNHVEHLFHDTSMSFDSIETPGWTSLVGTQQSKSTHAFKKVHQDKKPDVHNQILTRLNSLPKLKEKSEVEYSNIRLVPTSTKNKNIFVYGSLKNKEKKKMETPKSMKDKRPQSNSSSKRFLSRFNKDLCQPSQQKNGFHFNQNSKPHIFFSGSKSSQQKVTQDSRRRVSSARSQSSTNLKDQIKERLSMGNYKPKNITSEFESNIKTEPNKNLFESSPKPAPSPKFYSQIHSFQPIKEEKYVKKYLQKLNQRTKPPNNVKILKKRDISTELREDKGAVVQQSPSQSSSSNILPLTMKRFNTITIHDHLYQNHIKLESKKQMQRQIDESYQKANTLTFMPFISEKSHFLAESKFSRQSNAEYSSGHHPETCFRKGQNLENLSKEMKTNIFTIQQQVAMKQKQKMAEKEQNKSLIKLFLILSNRTKSINDNTLEVNIEKLPLALLEILEPLLTQIYKKNTYSERQFLEVFSLTGQQSIKSIAAKKQIIITLVERLVRQLQKNQRKQKEDKENIVDSLNNYQKEANPKLLLK